LLILLSESDLTAREFEAECQRSPIWGKVFERKTVRVVPVSNADHTFSAADTLDGACIEIIAWISELERRPESLATSA
jgi:hypothetical protein